MLKNTTKWDVRKYKSIRSPDGEAFEAAIYYDGKEVGDVYNDGWGGCNLYHFANRELEEQFMADATEWLRANEGWWQEYFREDGSILEPGDTFVEEIVHTHKCMKAAKKKLAGKLIVFHNESLLAWNLKAPGSTPANRERMARLHVASKYPGAVILNDLPLEEAVSYLVTEG